MSKPVVIIDEGKREVILVDDRGTPRTLAEAINQTPFLTCLNDSDPDEAERIARQFRLVIKDFLAQKFGRAYLESQDIEALQILYNECTL